MASLKFPTKSFLTLSPIFSKVSCNFSASSFAFFSASVSWSTPVFSFPLVSTILFFACSCRLFSAVISSSSSKNSIVPSFNSPSFSLSNLNGLSNLGISISRSSLGISRPPSNFFNGFGIISIKPLKI